MLQGYTLQLHDAIISDVCLHVCIYVLTSQAFRIRRGDYSFSFIYAFIPFDSMANNHVNPITGGGGAESAPPVVFLICTKNRLR